MTKHLPLLVLIALLAGSAAAQDWVEGNEVTFIWPPASGPVWNYAVYVDRGDGYHGSPEQATRDTEALIIGVYGETIMVRVAARDVYGNQGPFSLDSEPVTFVEPGEGEEPPGPVPVPEPPPLPIPMPVPNLVFYKYTLGNAREPCEERGLPVIKLMYFEETGNVVVKCLREKIGGE